MAFKLSARSIRKLEGVEKDLVAVVMEAINLTKVDFGVTYGLRTLEEQKKLTRPVQYRTMTVSVTYN